MLGTRLPGLPAGVIPPVAGLALGPTDEHRRSVPCALLVGIADLVEGRRESAHLACPIDMIEPPLAAGQVAIDRVGFQSLRVPYQLALASGAAPATHRMRPVVTIPLQVADPLTACTAPQPLAVVAEERDSRLIG
jgi:hypothetical protein